MFGLLKWLPVRIAVLLVAEHLSPFGSGITAMASHHEVPSCSADSAGDFNVMLQQPAARRGAEVGTQRPDTHLEARHSQELVQLVRRMDLTQKPAPPSVLDDPHDSRIDINIGTNFSPMRADGNNFLVLVDPLPDVCDFLRASTRSNPNAAVLCCAVSNYTGHATFLRYNVKGMSSSLSSTSPGTSHEKFQVKENITVTVLEAATVLRGYLAKRNKVYKLKTDMQGYDLTTLLNLQPILSMPEQVVHLKSECMVPNAAGRQDYQVDNNCATMLDYVQSLGYTAKVKMHNKQGDVYAYKQPASTFLSEQEWE